MSQDNVLFQGVTPNLLYADANAALVWLREVLGLANARDMWMLMTWFGKQKSM